MGKRLIYSKRKEIAYDMIMCRFLRVFFARRSYNALSEEFGLSHVALRKIVSGKTTHTCLLPEQVESLKLARKQAELLEPLRSRFGTKNNVAKYHGVSFHAVSRIERDFFDRRNKWRTPHVSE